MCTAVKWPTYMDSFYPGLKYQGIGLRGGGMRDLLDGKGGEGKKRVQ